MRWERLFADMEAQLDAEAAADLDAEVADRTRREHALIGLADRLRAAAGEPVAMTVLAHGVVSGAVAAVGADWVLIGAERPTLVPLAAIGSVTGLPPSASADVVGARLDLGYALRALARDRSPVRLCCVDGAVFTGTIDRVGADAVDLSEHPDDEPRRQGSVRGVRVVPFRAIALVRPV